MPERGTDMTRAAYITTAVATCAAILTSWAALCRWLTRDQQPTEAHMAKRMEERT